MTTQQSIQGYETKRQQVEESTAIDTGLIRCVCSSTEDDGFTIQCERCLVWQHAYCVQITHASIPEHYLCDQCSKRKRPKLSKRIPISKNKLRKLDSKDDPSFNTNKKRKHVKSRIISRHVHAIFREAKERWSRWKQQDGHLLYDHGPFVTMDATTLFTKGVLIDTPVSNQGLFTNRPIPALRYLMQVTGDVMLKSEFKFDPINDFVILGTPLSHIMFYPSLDLCIDTRQFGNKARYIRRSCHPNAELRNVVLPRDDKTIHLGLFARHLIEKGQQVTISWGWQRGHIAWKENMNWHHQHKLKQSQDEQGHQVIDEEEERRRKATIKSMLDRFEKEFGSCACLNKRRCLIEHLRRQIAPPKEKPLFKLPAVNILPSLTSSRRKSEIILLKPKPTARIKLGTEENTLDIDVTSNSPTLGAVKENSDDELLDVEGDIDIGGDDNLPTIKDSLPLLEDNSSDDDDDDQADLSSLSSLSSLSVFEESANDNITDDDENRIKARRKKQSSRHGKRSHHNPSSSSAPTVSSALPRKKLWMRDYLNKHIVSDGLMNASDSHSYNEKKYTNDTPMDIDTKMRLFESNNDRAIADATPEDIEAAKLLLDAMAANEIPYMHHHQHQHPHQHQHHHSHPHPHPHPHPYPYHPTDTTMTEHRGQHPTFDMDEGELSDASTILLDQDEIREAYRRESMDLQENRTDPPVYMPDNAADKNIPLPTLHKEVRAVDETLNNENARKGEEERAVEDRRVVEEDRMVEEEPMVEEERVLKEERVVEEEPTADGVHSVDDAHPTDDVHTVDDAYTVDEVYMVKEKRTVEEASLVEKEPSVKEKHTVEEHSVVVEYTAEEVRAVDKEHASTLELVVVVEGVNQNDTSVKPIEQPQIKSPPEETKQVEEKKPVRKISLQEYLYKQQQQQQQQQQKQQQKSINQ